MHLYSFIQLGICFSLCAVLNFRQSAEYKGDGTPIDTIAIVPYFDQSDYSYQIYKIQKEIEQQSNGIFKICSFDKALFTQSAPLKFTRKNYIYQTVPEKANILSGSYCPKVILFINDFQVNKEEKENTATHYMGTPGKAGGSTFTTTTVSLKTDVTIGFVYWDNRTNSVISYGRLKTRVANGAFFKNSTSGRAIEDIQDIAQLIIEKRPLQ